MSSTRQTADQPVPAGKPNAVPWGETPGPLPQLGPDGRPLPSAPAISVFFPAYNDGGTIASMVMEALATCQRITNDYEVLVIDDASSDYTPDLLDRLAADNDHVRVIHHKKNRGYGGALRSGFENSRKEFVFYTDGDAQYDPRELALLAARITPKVDVVQGYKIARHDPIFRIIIGRVYHHIVKAAFGLHIKDTDCDFRLMRRSALDRFSLESDSGTICVELVKKLTDTGARFEEVPVHHYHRVYGRSQFFNFPRLWRTGTQLLQLWWKLVVRREHMKEFQRRQRAGGKAGK